MDSPQRIFIHTAAAATAAIIFAIISLFTGALHVQPLELSLKVDEVDAVFGTGSGGIQIRADSTRSAEINADSPDFLRQTLLLEHRTHSGGRKAENAEAVDVDRATVEKLAAHGFHKIGEYTLDVAQGERTTILHLNGNAVQSGRLAPNHKLGIELARTVLLERILTKLFFVRY